MSEQTGKVVGEIAAERNRQIAVEGWVTAHDDRHDPGELAEAGAAYAKEAAYKLRHPKVEQDSRKPPPFWPWGEKWWKPKDPRRDLIRAAALIVAEIEKLDRANG